jgi:P22_AR N-terminal domain
VTSAIVKVPFQGDDIDCARVGDVVRVSVRRLCDLLGLDRNAQQQRLRDEDRCPWAVGCVTHLTAPGADGKSYRQLFIDLDALPMFLATVDASRVAASVRAKLVAYQRECAKALRDYFVKGAALNPNATLEQRVSVSFAVQRWLAEELVDHPALWNGPLVEALARLWKVPAKVEQAGGFPVGLISIVRRVYLTVLGPELYEAMRRKTGFGDDRDKRYKALKEEGYLRLSRELGKVEMLAQTCQSKREFLDKFYSYYAGRPLQAQFGW